MKPILIEAILKFSLAIAASRYAYFLIKQQFVSLETTEIDKYECDGCGKVFMHPIHNHKGYNSCSVQCDDFLDDIFEEMII